MKFNFNLKNPLWKTEPNYCRLGLEQELRKIMGDTPNDRPDLAVVYIRDILGEISGNVNKNREH